MVLNHLLQLQSLPQNQFSHAKNDLINSSKNSIKNQLRKSLKMRDIAITLNIMQNGLPTSFRIIAAFRNLWMFCSKTMLQGN